MGEGLTIGIKPNGSLIAWGSYNVTPPTGSFKSVSTGRNCAIAIDGNGSLVPFGANEYGRLNVPTGAFRSVSAADATWHAAGLRADGTIACWGFNNYGQANAPTGAFSAVAAGGHEVWSGFTVAVRSDGTLAAWGNNTWGQRNVPVGNNYRTISAGYYHALAIRSDNTLAGWGWNQHGQASVPAGQYLGVATGSTESAALRTDGTVVTFGSVPASVTSFFATRTNCTKVQIFCCEGATVLQAVDCDGNNIIDAVEVAADPSRDGNANGVLDLCESTLYVPTQYATIQAAIDAVPTGVQKIISVAPGTYNETFALNGKNVVVRGALGNATILNGTGLTTSIARFTGNEPATAGLENLVFRNGTVGSRFTPKSTFTIGGAIYANNSNAFIRSCRFENCGADFGGAIYQRQGTMDWDDLVFVGNTANDEGGAAMVYNVTGSATTCSFTGNRCGLIGGGSGSAFKAVGAFATGESVVLENCTITNNIALDFGAAVEFYEHVKFNPGVLRLIGCTISGNTSGDPIANGPGGLRVLGSQSSCVLSGGTSICGNATDNVVGPYLIEGSATVCDCEADMSGNGQVDAADLGILLSVWGTAPADGQGDLNHDGVVSAPDLSALLVQWGACPN
jgi:alpha-tubulin suppressor-like RCC1 family protein